MMVLIKLSHVNIVNFFFSNITEKCTKLQSIMEIEYKCKTIGLNYSYRNMFSCSIHVRSIENSHFTVEDGIFCI